MRIHNTDSFDYICEIDKYLGDGEWISWWKTIKTVEFVVIKVPKQTNCDNLNTQIKVQAWHSCCTEYLLKECFRFGYVSQGYYSQGYYSKGRVPPFPRVPLFPKLGTFPKVRYFS